MGSAHVPGIHVPGLLWPPATAGHSVVTGRPHSLSLLSSGEQVQPTLLTQTAPLPVKPSRSTKAVSAAGFRSQLSSPTLESAPQVRPCSPLHPGSQDGCWSLFLSYPISIAMFHPYSRSLCWGHHGIITKMWHIAAEGKNRCHSRRKDRPASRGLG